jgi:GNAT superfamily N-acetyltransferase
MKRPGWRFFGCCATLFVTREGIHLVCMSMLTITPEDPASAVSRQLLDELSATLAAITGDSGRSSFDPADVRAARALFVVARDENGQAVGCGAFRPLQDGIAEVKRMYSRPGSAGVGSAILAYLETKAAGLGYRALWLETRLVNERAVRFYEKRGYARIPNYGKYSGNPKAVCFEKRLGDS